jgi:hypothetical protein
VHVLETLLERQLEDLAAHERRSLHRRLAGRDPSTTARAPQSEKVNVSLLLTCITWSTLPFGPRNAMNGIGMLWPLADTCGPFAITSTSWLPSGSR